jgi:hypothetical protein
MGLTDSVLMASCLTILRPFPPFELSQCHDNLQANVKTTRLMNSLEQTIDLISVVLQLTLAGVYNRMCPAKVILLGCA